MAGDRDRYDEYQSFEVVQGESSLEPHAGRTPGRRRSPTAEIAPAKLLSEHSPFVVKPVAELTPHRTLCLARRPDSVASQQFRLLRHKLKEWGDPRFIGVTSAMPQEGKTTAAANLGLALAEGRQVKVMLLDLNLRQPALARRFGLSLLGSLADQIRRRQRQDDAGWDVHELRPRVHLMGGGEPSENPAPLLNCEQLSGLFNDLASRYDYVVVDLPAVLIAADVGSVTRHLDGLVLACRAGFSRRAAVRAATELLGRSRVYGVLMLDVEKRYSVA